MADLDYLRCLIALHDLGPADVDALGEIHRAILHDQPGKTATLIRWLDHIDLCNTVAGRRDENDDRVLLCLQGFTRAGVPLAVASPYSRAREPRSTALIYGLIDAPDPRRLLSMLVALENEQAPAPERRGRS